MEDPTASPAIARIQALVERYNAECTPAFVADLRKLFEEFPRDTIHHLSVFRTAPPRLEFSYRVGPGSIYQSAFIPLTKVTQEAIDDGNRMHCWWKFWE
jgi:hypothetical protein